MVTRLFLHVVRRICSWNIILFYSNWKPSIFKNFVKKDNIKNTVKNLEPPRIDLQIMRNDITKNTISAIIKRMLDQDYKNRMTVEQMLYHPLFYNAQKSIFH